MSLKPGKPKKEIKNMQDRKSSKKGFENLSGSDRVSFDMDFNPFTILNTELREFLAIPRETPHKLREEIAEVLIYELLSEKDYEIKDEKRFMEKFGVFYPVFLSMRNQQVWEEIKILAGENRMAGVFILKTLLEELFYPP